jgi:hypothetical protein
MRHRNDATSIVLILYALTCLVFAVPLLFFLGWGSGLVHWYELDPTVGKLMGAALAALAVSSFLAAMDPARHRFVVLTQLVFTALAALALGYRLLLGPGHTHDVGWVILGLLTLFTLLFVAFYPVDRVPEEA